MEYKEGARVYLADGKEVGRLSRVVIDPRSMQVTDIVIQRGTLKREERVAAATLIESGGDDEIHLMELPHGWDSLTPFEETSYQPLSPNDAADVSNADAVSGSAIYPYPPTVPVSGGMQFDTPGSQLPEMPYIPRDDAVTYRKETTRNIPEEAVTVNEGARVVSHDGAELGKVERLFTQPETGKVTHFLISRGMLLKERKAVPTDWIDVISDDEVLLGVNARFVEHLPDYQER